MNEAPDAEREPSPYIRLPWPAVAGGLLAFLALVLAVGLFANRNLRPQLSVVPTPSAAAQATTIPIPIAALASTQTNVPTSAPTSVVLVQVASATPTVRPTSAPPTATFAPAATATPTLLPTVEPVLADEVGQAYLMFWRVRSQALLELDDTHLSEVMDGDYLANVERRIDELRTEGRAIKTQVVLNYFVIQATPSSASVVDDFEDNSVYVKIGTDEPLTDPTANQLRVLYELRKFSGAWKVVDSVRSE